MISPEPARVIIVNPTAGRGRAGREIPAVRRLLERSSEVWTWRATQKAGDAELLARAAAEAGSPLVVAMGGDGTIYEAVNGLLGTETALGLLPFGTGNDLARTLGLFGNTERACRTLTEGRTVRLDVGVMSGTGLAEARRFLVVAGTGYVADVAALVNRGIGGLSGAAAYVWAAILTLRTFQPFRLSLDVDGEKLVTDAMFLAVANTPLTGGGMRIAPTARIDDGLLEICLVRRVPKWMLLYELTRVFRGEHVKNPAVTMLRGRHVRVDADPPQRLWADGDTMGSTPAEFQILPGAFPVKVPK